MGALLAVVALALACAGARAQQAPLVAAKAWLLADLTSGQVLAVEKADERFAPASLTKLMTAYVVFGALREGKLSRRRPGKGRDRDRQRPARGAAR